MPVSRVLFVVALVGLATFNGTYSPMLVLPLSAVRVVLPPLADASPEATLVASAAFWGLFTLMVAGIPAALVERLGRSERSTTLSLFVWLAGVVLLTVPAALRTLALSTQTPM